MNGFNAAIKSHHARSIRAVACPAHGGCENALTLTAFSLPDDYAGINESSISIRNGTSESTLSHSTIDSLLCDNPCHSTISLTADFVAGSRHNRTPPSNTIFTSPLAQGTAGNKCHLVATVGYRPAHSLSLASDACGWEIIPGSVITGLRIHTTSHVDSNNRPKPWTHVKQPTLWHRSQNQPPRLS